MSSIKIKVEVEKELKIPALHIEELCLCDSTFNCNGMACDNCLFKLENYKALLEQQKGDKK